MQPFHGAEHHGHAAFDITGPSAKNPALSNLATKGRDGHPLNGNGVLMHLIKDGSGWGHGGLVNCDKVIPKRSDALAQRLVAFVNQPSFEEIGEPMFEEKFRGRLGPAHRIDAWNLNELGQQGSKLVGSVGGGHRADL